MKFNKNEFGWKEKVNTNELPDDLSIGNSLTVGNRIGDIGIYSVAEGDNTTASGNISHAEGGYTTASGMTSHAEGFKTTASGMTSHAEGFKTTADGNSSHAEGYLTTASGNSSHAEGESSNSISAVISDFSPSTSNDVILTAWNTNKFSLAKGENSHVEGKDCLALGDNSHVEGGGTTASGYTSHAEGGGTTASGYTSHAEGGNTTASGEASHAEGFLTIASSSYQHVQGKYNTEDTESRYAHIVGNGNSNTRSNAHTLDWQGNAWFKGNVSIDGTPTNDNELVTKKYVDDAIASQPQISFDTEGNLVVTIGGVTKKFKEITK